MKKARTWMYVMFMTFALSIACAITVDTALILDSKTVVVLMACATLTFGIGSIGAGAMMYDEISKAIKRED